MRVLSVGEVGQYIKELFEDDELLGDLWINGEVTNLTRSRAGHYYFTLKDDTSQLRSVLFRGAALRCGAEPRAGDAVVVHGRIAFYEPNGSCELCVDLLYPSGTGVGQLRFEALRLKLEEEGLFALERKRPLIEFPRRVGLVTSQDGAVLHDVLTILSRRYPIAELVLAHSSVQGDRAPAEIVAALGRLRSWRGADGLGVDVVIVARGGGSPEELACFNDEQVARAIFASPWPVISAVGHETDVTICDYVADVRAPTPSAAAEIVAPDLRIFAQEVRDLAEAGRLAIQQTLAAHRADLRSRLDRLRLMSPLPEVSRGRQTTRDELERGRRALERHLAALREQLGGRRLQLAAMSPLATLARGYGIVTRTGERVVRSTREVGVGETVTVQLVDGDFEATTIAVLANGEQTNGAVATSGGEPVTRMR